MYFNRFDITNAFYLFATNYHGGQFSKEYRILGRLEKIKYKPGLLLSVKNLNPNEKEIYMNLLRKNGFKDICPLCKEEHTEDSTCDYEECGECQFDHHYEPKEAEDYHRKLAHEHTGEYDE